jgi:hypothetical protein
LRLVGGQVSGVELGCYVTAWLRRQPESQLRVAAGR